MKFPRILKIVVYASTQVIKCVDRFSSENNNNESHRYCTLVDLFRRKKSLPIPVYTTIMTRHII